MQGLKLSDVGINANRIILLEIRKKYLSCLYLFKFDWQEIVEKWLEKINNFNYQKVFFDINNYRLEHEQKLKELAQKAARECSLYKKEIKLPIMTAYERKIIHSELSLRPDIYTESEGEDPNRYVVIKPLD